MFELLKLNKFQALWLPFIAFLLIGAVWILSMFYFFLGVIGFIFFSFLTKNSMDNLSSAYLHQSVNYNFKYTSRLYKTGVYHIFTSVFKGLVGYFIASLVILLVTFVSLSGSGSPLLKDFQDFFTSRIITDSIEPLIIVFVAVPNLVFLLVFLFTVRQNELVIYFAGTFMNRSSNHFIFTPMLTRFYKVNFYKTIRKAYFKEVWLEMLISALLLVGSTTGFIFLFLNCHIETFLSISLASAIGLVFYSFGYSFGRLHDAVYFVQRKEKIIVDFNNSQLDIISSIENEMAKYFVEGKFYSKKAMFGLDGSTATGEMSSQELDFLAEQLFVRYKDNQDSMIVDVASEMSEEEEDDIIFGTDISEGDSK